MNGLNQTINTLQKSFDDSFGNYLLHGIEEIFLPETVSWWPTTIAWHVVIAGLLLCGLILLYRFIQQWRKNHYRRMAIKSIDQLCLDSDVRDVLLEMPVILKATALKSFPRSEIAHLTGSAWLELLDSKCRFANFNSSLGQHLLSIAYQPEDRWHLDQEESRQLISLVRMWIQKHDAAKRG